jgi:electron transfer flavoprotein beta subunit
MKIVVLAKHVPDATGERGFTSDGTVDRASSAGLLSELDEYAVEQALQIADDHDDVEVVIISVGPPEAADAIKRALQMGASAAIHISDEAIHGSDALASSLVLAEAIKRTAPDLVICGMASTDGTMGVIPAMIAERLGWPAATLGATLSVSEDRLTIRRDTEPHGRGTLARDRQRDRSVGRGPLPLDEGDSRGQEEAGGVLDTGRPRY